ncbi:MULTISPECIES: hypothetical protein [Cyanophyceae]|uniref:hypothetical protein n=1 Tax=Cyanophyceae TaxID=3028117 RepID=UPI002330EA6F|nr:MULTISPECIES: hypothetical protein [Cyanophyceae]MDB9354824.1 hypothetical protein [Nodularia spumigena CS-587/03]MDB9316977.1 hypothetical protein [Nodularia spumigena CS-590/01A]MDB9321874.1 hypothetical protein [Nodularia spumigena CS-591/07A]MDB9328057.1 hypothetical protein [Nodularia spumigena CS-590/02]MDB9330089.1 hypothetical protein [Nodularia spumigena CS-591/04]
MPTNYNLEVSTCSISKERFAIAPKSKPKYHNIVQFNAFYTALACVAEPIANYLCNLNKIVTIFK